MTALGNRLVEPAELFYALARANADVIQHLRTRPTSGP